MLVYVFDIKMLLHEFVKVDAISWKIDNLLNNNSV